METGKTYINQILAGDTVVSTFFCEKKSRQTGKTGPYLSVTLQDKSGKMEARVWDNVEQIDSEFEEGDFVRIKGEAVNYRGQIQMRLHRIKTVGEEDIDPSDYLPCTTRNQDEMLEELATALGSLKNSNLKALAYEYLKDREFVAMLKRAPAAKAIHHPYLGGLLEHMLSILKLVDLICSHYTQLDRDIILMGAFLHDLGKLKELSFERSIDYTTPGRLIGHITLGIEMMNDKIRNLPGFPDKYKHMLTHMMLSHHGQLEFGSPVLPQTLEAVVLSFIDDMDARINSFEAILEQETNASGDWTNWQRLYNRYLFRWEKDEAGQGGGDANSGKSKKQKTRNTDSSMELPFGIKGSDE